MGLRDYLTIAALGTFTAFPLVAGISSLIEHSTRDLEHSISAAVKTSRDYEANLQAHREFYNSPEGLLIDTLVDVSVALSFGISAATGAYALKITKELDI